MSMSRTYDSWKASGPHEDMPSVERDDGDTCEHCGHPVAPVDPAWCDGCHTYSDRAKRPEQEDSNER